MAIYFSNKILDLKASMQTLEKSLTNPLQTLNSIVSTLQQASFTIGSEIEKIKGLSEKFAETEKITKSIHHMLIGSYSKGKTGENILKTVMADLMKMGIIKINQPFGTKTVEYCLTFKNGKILPIDSKVIATTDIEKYYSEETTIEEKEKIKNKIKEELKRKINEVSKYIDPEKTLPCAIMAIPDAAMELTLDIIPEAIQRNIIIVGYSSLPQLLTYFIQIHNYYSIEEDIEEIQRKLTTMKTELSKYDEKFFQNRIEKPLKIIINAVEEIKRTITNLTQTT